MTVVVVGGVFVVVNVWVVLCRDVFAAARLLIIMWMLLLGFGCVISVLVRPVL